MTPRIKYSLTAAALALAIALPAAFLLIGGGEDARAAYERGVALKQHCEKKLREAQSKIEKITLGADGKPTASAHEL